VSRLFLGHFWPLWNWGIFLWTSFFICKNGPNSFLSSLCLTPWYTYSGRFNTNHIKHRYKDQFFYVCWYWLILFSYFVCVYLVKFSFACWIFVSCFVFFVRIFVNNNQFLRDGLEKNSIVFSLRYLVNSQKKV